MILERVPAVTDLDDTEKNEILGEAHCLRALHYHNLVKLCGDVPMPLTSVKSVNEAGADHPDARWPTSTPRSWPTWARRAP